MTSPRTLLNAWDMRAKKQLGQNFLADPSTAGMIVDSAHIHPEDVVLEIGAGLGALTVPAAKKARKVFAVETDSRLIGLLKNEILAHNLFNVNILKTDILNLEISELDECKPRRLVVIGNLPYHISSQIVIRLIQFRQAVDRAVLMFQKELAMRIVTGPGTRAYGRISVMIQYCADIGKDADIGSTQFFPKPKVDSQVLSFRFRHPPAPAAVNEADLFRLVKAAFSKRRKTLKNALVASELHLAPERAEALLTSAGIDPVRRAETLTVDEFVKLSNGWSMEGQSGSSSKERREFGSFYSTSR